MSSNLGEVTRAGIFPHKKKKRKCPTSKWRTVNSLVHKKNRLQGRRGKGTAESFSREKIKASTTEGRWRNPGRPSSCVTPAGTSTIILTFRIYGMATHNTRTLHRFWLFLFGVCTIHTTVFLVVSFFFVSPHGDSCKCTWYSITVGFSTTL